jgi:hypothetical protein
VTDGPTLVLFVDGNSANGLLAAANLRKALVELNQSAALVETVDVYDQPDRALSARVFLTPTLVASACALRIVGDLSGGVQLAYFLRVVYETSPQPTPPPQTERDPVPRS